MKKESFDWGYFFTLWIAAIAGIALIIKIVVGFL